MGKCNMCNGSGKVRDKPPFENFISTCKECGGTGSDEKPICEEHKVKKKYSGIIGWYCPKCNHGWSRT